MKRILLACFFTLLFSAGICKDEMPDDNSTTTEIDKTTTEIITTTTEIITTTELVTTTLEPVTTTTSSAEPLPNTTTTLEPVTTEPPVTTTNVPVTTKAPEPIPKPEKGSWNITQNNVTCIRAELEILFVIPIQNKTTYIALSPNATSGFSDCYASNDTQTLVLNDDDYTFTILFEKNAGKAYVKNITLQYTLLGETDLVFNGDKKFSVNVGHSYQCRTKEDISLSNVTMQVMDIHIQAFGAKDDKGFTTAEECEADDKVGDAVPIAVACALAALIIVVLIAYLVGRRRSRQRGYQSV